MHRKCKTINEAILWNYVCKKSKRTFSRWSLNSNLCPVSFNCRIQTTTTHYKMTLAQCLLNWKLDTGYSAMGNFKTNYDIMTICMPFHFRIQKPVWNRKTDRQRWVDGHAKLTHMVVILEREKPKVKGGGDLYVGQSFKTNFDFKSYGLAYAYAYGIHHPHVSVNWAIYSI